MSPPIQGSSIIPVVMFWAASTIHCVSSPKTYASIVAPCHSTFEQLVSSLPYLAFLPSLLSCILNVVSLRGWQCACVYVQFYSVVMPYVAKWHYVLFYIITYPLSLYPSLCLLLCLSDLALGTLGMTAWSGCMLVLSLLLCCYRLFQPKPDMTITLT